MKQRPVEGPCSAGAVENVNPGRADVVGERRAERIALDLADIGRGHAERGDADDRVGGRPAGNHPRIDSGGVKRFGAILVDEVHRALQHLLGAEIVVVGVSEKIDQRIAQPQNLDRRAHRPSRIISWRFLALAGDAVNHEDHGLAPARRQQARLNKLARASDAAGRERASRRLAAPRAIAPILRLGGASRA